MKTATASVLVAFALLDAALAAPVSAFGRRQLGIPGTGDGSSGTGPSIPSGVFPSGGGGGGLPTGFPSGLPPGFPSPTGLPTGLPPGFPSPTGFPTGLPPGFPSPTGFPTGLPPGFPSPTGFPTGLPPGFPIPSGIPSKRESGGSSSSNPFSGLAGIFGGGSSTTPSIPVTGADAGGFGGVGSFAGGSSENDITNKAGCTPLTVIFARGTSEAGNVGSVAGPPMFKAIQSTLGTSITVQGVDYPASAAGNANLGADGGPTMSKLVTQSLTQCPDSKIILSGYSQGAMVVHNAASQSGFPAAKIAGVVLFGDPLNGSAVKGVDSSKVKEICANGDALCSGGGVVITPAHLSYGNNAQEAADFVKSVSG